MRIDVLIPAYNADRTISESVASIQRQTYDDLSIIVVNDGSTDSTGEILSALSVSDPRIQVITTENRGIVSALNTGLEACRSPIIARHDADDIAFPNRLRKQYDFLVAHPDCVAVGANVWHIDVEGKRLRSSSGFAGVVECDATSIPSREPYLLHPFLSVRRSALVKIGGYRHVFHSEDTDLYWRLLNVGRLHNLEERLGEYRIHQGSISSASIRNGRIAAIYSQLAAISYLRRSRGKYDLEFPREDLATIEQFSTIQNMLKFAGRELDSTEMSYLCVATAAKILQIASYRPYTLTLTDCKFIINTLQSHISIIGTDDRRQMRRYKADVIQRYFKSGDISQIFGLRPSLLVCGVLAKRLLSSRW